MTRDQPDGFADFVRSRSPTLLRAAWLLTDDPAKAEDLLQTALGRLLNVWLPGRPVLQSASRQHQYSVNGTSVNQSTGQPSDVGDSVDLRVDDASDEPENVADRAIDLRSAPYGVGGSGALLMQRIGRPRARRRDGLWASKGVHRQHEPDPIGLGIVARSGSGC